MAVKTAEGDAPLQFMTPGVYPPQSSDGPRSTGEQARMTWNALPAQRPFTEAEFERILMREFSIPSFDHASAGVAMSEAKLAGLVTRDDEGLYRRVREFPERLLLRASEQLMLNEQDRLNATSEEQRRAYAARDEQRRQAAILMDDTEYANASRHIARYLRESGLLPDAQPVSAPAEAAIADLVVQANATVA